MRICISTGIFPPDIGGPATYVPAIAAALSERGHTVSAVTLSDSLSDNNSYYPFAVHRIRRAQPKWWRLPQTIWAILRCARHADVVLANGLFIESALAARLIRRPLVMKVVGDWAWERAVSRNWVTGTIDEFQSRTYDLKVEALKTLRALVSRQAVAVITPSRYLQRVVMGWGVRSGRLHVIHNAEAAPPVAQRGALTPFQGRTVVTVGRLVPWKGFDRVLRVVAGLPQVRLLIVGDGPERASLESIAGNLDLKDRVIFAGQVSKDRVLSYLRAGDVFVLNSTYEGLPHVVLEAMHAGVAVIATDVGGTGELVKHGINGLLIRPDDDAGLRMALQRMLADPEKRARLAEAGRQTAANDFSPCSMVSLTESLLLRVSRTRE